MNIAFIKNIVIAIGKHFAEHGIKYAMIAIGAGVGSVIGMAACNAYYKKLITKTTQDQAEKMTKEFAKRVKEIEDKYKNNEYVLKKKINDLCDEFGIEHVA